MMKRHPHVLLLIGFYCIHQRSNCTLGYIHWPERPSVRPSQPSNGLSFSQYGLVDDTLVEVEGEPNAYNISSAYLAVPPSPPLAKHTHGALFIIVANAICCFMRVVCKRTG